MEMNLAEQLAVMFVILAFLFVLLGIMLFISGSARKLSKIHLEFRRFNQNFEKAHNINNNPFKKDTSI